MFARITHTHIVNNQLYTRTKYEKTRDLFYFVWLFNKLDFWYQAIKLTSHVLFGLGYSHPHTDDMCDFLALYDDVDKNGIKKPLRHHSRDS